MSYGAFDVLWLPSDPYAVNMIIVSEIYRTVVNQCFNFKVDLKDCKRFTNSWRLHKLLIVSIWPLNNAGTHPKDPLAKHMKIITLRLSEHLGAWPSNQVSPRVCTLWCLFPNLSRHCWTMPGRTARTSSQEPSSFRDMQGYSSSATLQYKGITKGVKKINGLTYFLPRQPRGP